MPIDIPQTLDRLCYRYPSLLVDTILEHEAGRRVVAIKNVTVSEEFFQGHFPGTPLMPAVLMIESFVQAATILILGDPAAASPTRVFLRGVNDAKFRRQVVPGDRLRVEVTLGRRRGALAVAQASAFIDDQTVAECELLLGLATDGVSLRTDTASPTRFGIAVFPKHCANARCKPSFTSGGSMRTTLSRITAGTS